MISSPYDVEARCSIKRETAWTGYKIHLTETCDDDTPSIITDVATTPATTTDYEATAGIHDRLAERGLLPCEHLVRGQCISHDRPRALMVRAQPQFDALMAARQRQTTEVFKARYAKRAGVEGTISQGVQRCELRRTRFSGLAKTAQGHRFIAAALNLVRVAVWLAGVPRSTTRRSAFAALAPAAA